MQTYYSLINTYQNRENYNFTEDGGFDTENPRWKLKGSTEQVVETELSDELPLDVLEDKSKEASRTMCEPNGAYEHDFMGFKLVEHSDRINEIVFEYIQDTAAEEGQLSNSVHYLKWNADEVDLCGYQVEIALDHLHTQGLVRFEGEGFAQKVMAVCNTERIRRIFELYTRKPQLSIVE